jgi:hypothetical protein
MSEELDGLCGTYCKQPLRGRTYGGNTKLRSLDLWLSTIILANCKSRMMGDYHVRFCERLGVKLPLATRHS